MLKQICNLKKKDNLTNEEIIKVEKYRYYWDVYNNNNYTKALPYELQNIILSFIDPNTRMKILKAIYYKKIKSLIANDITTNTPVSQLYGILKHILAFRKCGIFGNGQLRAVDTIGAPSFNEFRSEYKRYPYYVVTYFRGALSYILKNYTTIYKTIENLFIIFCTNLNVQRCILHPMFKHIFDQTIKIMFNSPS